MKIKVTNEDIKTGEPCNSQMCAISMSLKRHFKTDDTSTDCDFDSNKITLRVDDKKYKVKEYCQYAVGEFIDKYDNYIDDDNKLIDDSHIIIDEDAKPKPFTFEIEEVECN